MGSFLKSFRGNGGSATPSAGMVPAKKEPQAPTITPLEKVLLDMGPIRVDGSDKFFGMENYGSLEAALAQALRYQNPNTLLEAESQAEKQKVVNPPRPGAPPNQQQKPEDKDSPEYKKKVAFQTLPLLDTKSNAASYGMSESLFTSLKDIFESVVGSQSRIGIIRPQQFLEVLRREHEMFRTAMHQDAHEFLNLLLNEVVANVEAEAAKQPFLEKSLPSLPAAESVDSAGSSGSKTPSTTRWVHELFEGTLTSETQCLTCEKVSQRDEIFLDLSVDLEQHSSVTSCLRKFSAEEMLCERNKFHCDNCGGLQEAERRMKIKRLPRILALHLKRFKYTEDQQRLQKLFHRVVYPYHLRLFNTTDDTEDPDRFYELYAVVVHIGGGPYHGHYVAIIKTEDRGWLLFDDEMVEPVDKNFVRNFFGDKPGLACAYVLFYQETTLEAVMKEQEQEDMDSNIHSAETNEATNKQNGFPQSSLAHVQSESQIPSHDEPTRLNGLRRAPTAPPLTTQPEHTDSESSPSDPSITISPPIPPIPQTNNRPLSPQKSDLQARKERAREEKERKAAEKEKEKADKQRRKEQLTMAKETHRREQAELKAALDASKASKADEDRRIASENGKEKQTSGLSRLKRGSKSLSHRLGKDKEGRGASSAHLPPLPARERSISRNGSSEPQQQQPLKNDLPQNLLHPNMNATKEEAQTDHKDTKHGKWRSFSIGKRSLTTILS